MGITLTQPQKSNSDPNNNRSHHRWSIRNDEVTTAHTAHHRRHIRNDEGTHSPPKIWAKGVVPYSIDEKFGEAEVQAIQRGLEEIMAKTCVKFVKRKNETDFVLVRQSHSNHMHKNDQHEYDICTSHVGRQGGMQVLHLTPPGCMAHGSIVHEFLHALGAEHEHCRHDRDNFIDIVWANVEHGMKYNFNKIPETQAPTFDLPYDFSSVMHYTNTAFAIDSAKPTIESKVRGKHVPTKHASRLSTMDAVRINRMYNFCK